jgi:VanZ family protein
VLGVLLTRAFAGAAWAGYTTDAVLQAWVAATLYAVTDELHQAFVPGRTPSVGDGVADAAGAALGAFVTLAVGRRVRRARRARGRRTKEREV